MTNSESLRTVTTDALTGVRSLANNSVQVALTSPPFYLLRRYGTPAIWPDGWKGELGHENHPNDFVRHLLNVFDESLVFSAMTAACGESSRILSIIGKAKKGNH